MKLLSLGVAVSEGQLCTLPSPQLCSIPLGILEIPDLLLCLCVSPQQWCCQEKSQCHSDDMLYSAIYSIFSSFLSLCLHGCSWEHVPSPLGAPPKLPLSDRGAAFPSVQFLVPLSPGCIPVTQQNWDTAMGHFLCPQPRGLSCPTQPAPASLHTGCACHSTGECLQSHL